MKRQLYILTLIILYFILCGKSCVDENAWTTWQEEQVMTAKDSIRGELEVDFLSEDARYAAEFRAMQALNDLAGYVGIYSDDSMDPLFREKAGEMTRDMFISEDARLSFGLIKNKKMKSLSLDEFLKTGFGDDINKAEVIFDSIRVKEPLQKSDEDIYSGKLAAYQTIILHPLADSIISSSKPVTIHFISSKQAKIIGKDTLKIWEVKLKGLE